MSSIPPTANRHPLRLTQSAVRKLPRLTLAIVLVAYSLPGLFARDPWRGDDAIGFGIMWTMAEGHLADWLMPNVQGLPVYDDGPLMFWIGGLFVRLVGRFITPDEAARLAPLAAMAVAATALWWSTFLLGRRREAQPQALAFGGQPDPRAYGRALADGCLLIGLGTLGLLLRAHETSTEIAAFAMFAVTSCGLAVALERPVRGAVVFGLGVTGLTLTHGPFAAGAGLLTGILAFAGSREWRRVAIRFWPVATAAIAVPLWIWFRAVLALGAPGHDWMLGWWNGQEEGWWLLQPTVWAYYLRNLAWFIWPAWPIAAWALWTWRFQRDQPQFVLPLAGFVSALLYFGLGDSPSDSTMLAGVVPVVLLAAFGLPALKRSAANLIDWFALTTFSIFALTIWCAWAISLTGFPARIAGNFARVLPGYVAQFNPFAFAVGFVLTVLWAALVRWRLLKSPVVIWRSAVLSAGGVVMSWALFMTLLLPAADYRKSYRTVASAIAERVPEGDCVRGDPVGLPQRAAIAYLGPVTFDAECGLRLVYHDEAGPAAPDIDLTAWSEVWRGARPGDTHEEFVLYRRFTRTALPPAPETSVAEPEPGGGGRGRSPVHK